MKGSPVIDFEADFEAIKKRIYASLMVPREFFEPTCKHEFIPMLTNVVCKHCGVDKDRL